MRRDVLFGLLTLACVVLTTRLVAGDGGAGGGISCSSCGSECQEACGTRHFRACCFNFQRRRRANFVFEKANVVDGDGVEDVETPEGDLSKGLLASLVADDSVQGNMDGADSWARVRKLLNFLSYRGYSPLYPGYRHGLLQFHEQVPNRSKSF